MMESNLVSTLNTIRDPALITVVLTMVFFLNRNYVTKETNSFFTQRLENLETKVQDNYITKDLFLSEMSHIASLVKNVADHVEKLETRIH